MVKSFRPVQNNQPVIGGIKKLSGKNKALSLATYDLSTLYTNISHNEVKAWWGSCSVSLSKVVETSLMSLTKFCATWIDDKNKFKTTFDKTSAKLAINFLLDNFFLILIICHFGKSLESPWVLAQNPLWQIHFYITMRVVNIRYGKDKFKKSMLF